MATLVALAVLVLRAHLAHLFTALAASGRVAASAILVVACLALVNAGEARFFMADITRRLVKLAHVGLATQAFIDRFILSAGFTLHTT